LYFAEETTTSWEGGEMEYIHKSVRKLLGKVHFEFPERDGRKILRQNLGRWVT
jgi:hypothetical protein